MGAEASAPSARNAGDDAEAALPELTGAPPLPLPGAERESGAAFVAVAESLHHELEGMRAAARLRAVIEQAKGILVAEDGISLDDAFERLRELSQTHNVRLVEVAATVVGAHLPPGAGLDVDLSAELPPLSEAASTTWSSLREEDDVRAGTATALLDARASATTDPDETRELLRALCASLRVDAAALYRFTEDQRLAAVTSFGFPDVLMRAWAAVPPGVDVPVMRAVVTGRTVVLRNRGERDLLFPRLLTDNPPTSEALVVAPIRSHGAVLGSLAVAWYSAQTFEQDEVARAERVAEIAGPVLLRVAAPAYTEQGLLRTVLGVMFDPWLLLEPVVQGGRAIGFRVRAAARDLPHADSMAGRRLLELWPDLGPNGIFDHLLRVHATGLPWVSTLDTGQAGALPLAGPGTEVRVVRLGPALLLHWRPAAGIAGEGPGPRSRRRRGGRSRERGRVPAVTGTQDDVGPDGQDVLP
jgi:hypothetical protein